MSSSFKNPNIVGVASQSQPATSANHLVRYAELMVLLAAAGGGVAGSVAVASGVASGTVTFTPLAFTPTRCFLTVSAPDDTDRVGLSIQVVGPVSSGGFSWEFTNGVPDISGYKFHYLLLP